MGQFLSIALVDSSFTKSKNEVINFSNDSQGEYKNMSEETIEEDNILYSKIKSLTKKTSAVLFPVFYQDYYNCSQYISDKLKTRTLTAHIHDGDLWLVYLFEKGKEVTRFLSSPEIFGEKKENWLLDFDIIEASYGIDRNTIKISAVPDEKDLTSIDPLMTEEELFDFLFHLGYPVDAIRDYESGYRHIIPDKELKRLTKSFLTVDDLKKTKKYSSGLLPFDKQIAEVFKDEIDFMEDYKVCQTCGKPTINNQYFLNIDVLCVQLYGECPTCGHKKGQLLMNYGFIHKMEEIRDYLNE
jgi:hypothetical protein